MIVYKSRVRRWLRSHFLGGYGGGYGGMSSYGGMGSSYGGYGGMSSYGGYGGMGGMYDLTRLHSLLLDLRRAVDIVVWRIRRNRPLWGLRLCVQGAITVRPLLRGHRTPFGRTHPCCMPRVRCTLCARALQGGRCRYGGMGMGGYGRMGGMYDLTRGACLRSRRTRVDS